MEAEFENGFAVVDRGDWLMDVGQPAAESGDRMFFAAKSRPFLTRIDLGERVSVVADKILLAPMASKKGRRMVRVVPFSFKDAIRTYELEIGWVVMATSSRARRVVVEEGDTLSVAPSAAVAWTGNRPTGFCPRLRLRDLLLPRKPRLRLNFHGPCIVWIEGA